MSSRRALLRLAAIFVWFCLFALSSLALAQGPTPIQIGQNVPGQVTADVSSAQFAVTSSGGETATIQILGFGGFVPRFRVLNPQGIEILTVSNPDGLTTLARAAAFADAGAYTIEVQGENGSTGQFALSLQPGAPLPAAVELSAGQPISAFVGSQTPVQVYHFRTTSIDTADRLTLTVMSLVPDAGALVSLYNEDAGRTIASSDAGVLGLVYRLPAQELGYRVEVRAGDSSGDVPFTICLGPCGSLLAPAPPVQIPASPTLAPIPVNPTAGSNVAVACTVASGTGVTVNLRSGPGTQYAILSSLLAGQTYPVVGRWTGGDWYQLNMNGQPRWAAGSVVRLDGNCATLPFVDAPANAQLAPTNAPTPSQTPDKTATPTNTPEPAKLPDLIVAIQGAQHPAPGLPVDVYYLIINNGEAPSGPFTLNICVDSQCQSIVHSDSVAPGQQETNMKSIVPDNYPLGVPHTVIATIDPNNEVKESNEDNNVSASVAP